MTATVLSREIHLKAPADITTLLAPDGDHPNAVGHRVIADAVADALDAG